jgi:hypothetical protein
MVSLEKVWNVLEKVAPVFEKVGKTWISFENLGAKSECFQKLAVEMYLRGGKNLCDVVWRAVQSQ